VNYFHLFPLLRHYLEKQEGTGNGLNLSMISDIVRLFKGKYKDNIEEELRYLLYNELESMGGEV
jgi:hypothetical protein